MHRVHMPLVVIMPLFVLLACSSGAGDEGSSFTSFTTVPGDGDGDTAETGTGDGDGDGDPGDGDGAPVSCGDGVVDTGEECDLGEMNSNSGQCTESCQIAQCGDGLVLEGIEECDDGNPVNTDDCVDGCKIAVCGDGFVQDGVEACDDANQDETDGCTTDCTPFICGDGVIQPGEQCDDGNDITTDNCPACQLSFCGDGFVFAGVEECDDGNLEDTDACLTGCVPASCGDGFVRAGVEECDDGNLDDTDACVGACAIALCGDGFTQAGVEQCDDGNMVNNDACANDCTANCSPGSVAIPITFNQTMGWLAQGCCNEPNYRVANNMGDIISANFNGMIPPGTAVSSVTVEAGIRHACNNPVNAFEFRLNNTVIGTWNSGMGPHCSCGDPAIAAAMFNGTNAFVANQQNTISVVHNATGSCHEALGTVPGEQAGTAFVINVNYACN